MLDALKAALAKLDGWKTHISVVLAALWVIFYLKFPDAKTSIGLENFGAVFAALLGAAGISLRSAVAKVASDASSAAATNAPRSPADASPAGVSDKTPAGAPENHP
jgi:hypothetical protein